MAALEADRVADDDPNSDAETRGVTSSSPSVDTLLAELRAGRDGALDRLLAHVYPELRRLAQAVFSSQAHGHTLQPTALLHEAWMKLARNADSIQDRRHFFVVAGMAMRQVIADHARGRSTQKRGGHVRRVSLDVALSGAPDHGVDLVALDDCLARLATLNPRHGRVAELRLFSGLSIAETAAELGVSPRSVDSDWAMAKAWLRAQLA